MGGGSTKGGTTKQPGTAKPSPRLLIALVVGMAFWWQYLRHTNIGDIFAPDGSAPSPELGGSPLWLWAFYGSALVAALVVRCCPRLRVAKLSERPAVTLGTGILSFALVTAGSLAAIAGHRNPALDVAGACALGASFVVFSLGWVRMCVQLAAFGFHRMVLCVCASSLLSFALATGLFTLAPIPGILRATVPLVTAALLAWSQHMQAPPKPTDPSRAPELPGGLVALNVALLVVVVCVKGMYDTSMPHAVDATLYLKHAITVVELVAIMSVGMLAVGFKRFAFLGWVVLTGGLVTGCVALSLANSDAAGEIGLGTIAAARTCLEVFVLLLAVMRAQAHGGTGTRETLAMFLIPDMAACLVGYGALPALLAPLLVGSTSVLRVVTVALGTGLVLCAFLVMSALALRGLDAQDAESRGTVVRTSAKTSNRQAGEDGRFGRTETRLGYGAGSFGIDRPRPEPTAAPPAQPGAPSPDGTPPAWVGQLAAQYGLTPRECDVAAFVYRGYSAKRTGELMHLTLNTVQSHTRNLYRKLNIHSRQELIDLVDQPQGRRKQTFYKNK